MGLNRANVNYYLENQIPGDNGRLTGKVFEDEITLTTAEILAIFTTPKELVAAPGANKVLQFMGGAAFLDFNSIAYTTYGIVTVKYTDGSGTAVSEPVAADKLVQSADDVIAEVCQLSADAELTQNAALVLACDTGNPLAGDSPIRFKIFYRILDFS